MKCRGCPGGLLLTGRPSSCKEFVQQLREAFPEVGPYRYVILDRDAKFDGEVVAFLQGTGLTPKRTGIRSPWQNGIAERWVGSCRRELLDHVIPLNEQHLRRLVRDYVVYYQEDRIHDASAKTHPICGQSRRSRLREQQ